MEKEFAQTTGREKTSGLTDRQTLHTVLSKPENRYLARQFCWVMTVEGLETYVLTPRDPADLHLLVESVRPNPSPMDLDVVIGMKGPIAPPRICNGLMVPSCLRPDLLVRPRCADHQGTGEQSGEQMHPNEAGSPQLRALAPACKLLRRLKRRDRGRFSKPPHSATLPPLRRFCQGT